MLERPYRIWHSGSLEINDFQSGPGLFFSENMAKLNSSFAISARRACVETLGHL